MAKKNTSKSKRTSASRGAPRVANDNISALLDPIIEGKGLVPAELRGTDRFLDVVCWNIRYFNVRDPDRVKRITNIMSEINADVFILEEIEDDSLDDIARRLTDRGRGLYKVRYGTTGGDQRVAMVYDMEFVRAKEEIAELFPENPKMPGTARKYVFPRLPLHSYFTCVAQPGGSSSAQWFDFHLVGVHLKSQRASGGDDGTAQRTAAAKRLADWVKSELGDEPDIIIAGDWNAVPSKPEWAAIRALEQQGKAAFVGWNNGNEASHFYKSGKGTRLDLVMVSADAEENAVTPGAKVIAWKNVFKNKSVLAKAVENISDHMPVLSRFYFEETGGGQ